MHDVPFFDRVAPLYDLVTPSTDAEPLTDGLAMAERSVRTVVDLGGGTGRASRALDSDPVVLDGSIGMLQKARNQGHEVVRGDVRHLPLADGSVDGVVCVDAMHHFPAVDRVVEEVVRVLRVGGAFVVREFDPTTIRGRGLVAAEHLVGFDSTFFATTDLADLLADAGLDVTVTERGFVYTLVGVKPGAGR